MLNTSMSVRALVYARMCACELRALRNSTNEGQVHKKQAHVHQCTLTSLVKNMHVVAPLLMSRIMKQSSRTSGSGAGAGVAMAHPFNSCAYSRGAWARTSGDGQHTDC